MARRDKAAREAARKLAGWEKKLRQAKTLDELRGWEGTSSALYFRQMARFMSPDWGFRARKRRPPPDPVNAMLGYGYALALGEMVAVLNRRGLDTRIGVVHGIRYGRASLALDLIEEFRVPLVDRFVFKVLNRRQFEPEDFEPRDGGIYMTQDARRRFLEMWELMMREPGPLLRHEQPEQEQETSWIDGENWDGKGDNRTWRQRMDTQARRFRRWLMDEEPYVPLQKMSIRS